MSLSTSANTSRSTRGARSRRRGAADEERPTDTSSPQRGALRSVLLPAMVGSLALFAALPPLGWSALGWLAPACWVAIALHPELPRRSYAALWLAGFTFWMCTLHWLTLPHPATSIGWVALSAYLGCYLPVFVSLVRVGVQRLGGPVLLIAPVVWVGLEKAQAHLLTGFSMGAVSHTQYRWPVLIQISDLAGAYTLSFVMITAAAWLACQWPRPAWRTRRWWLGTAWLVALLASTLAYGMWRLGQEPDRPGPRIALVQGSIDTEMKANPQFAGEVFAEYIGLSQQVRERHDDLDLIVWPETMYRDSLLTSSTDAFAPADMDWTMEDWRQQEEMSREGLARLADLLDAPLLLGIDRAHCGRGVLERYNSAVHVARDGQLLGYYDKMHPVLFGEYVPFAKRWPWLYGLTPLGGGIEEGRQPVAFEVEGARLSASVCYENVLPHLIRGQAAQLAQQGESPDLLINLTNDGWFWGSSELDLHLICGVFRAVECRKPMLIAANTGFSAWIDSNGRILQQGPRRDRGWIVADTQLDDRQSLYISWGDTPSAACLAICVLLAVVGLWRRRTVAPVAAAA